MAVGKFTPLIAVWVSELPPTGKVAARNANRWRHLLLDADGLKVPGSGEHSRYRRRTVFLDVVLVVASLTRGLLTTWYRIRAFRLPQGCHYGWHFIHHLQVQW